MMPAFQVFFNYNWPAYGLDAVETVFPTDVKALEYLIGLLNQHYPGQWRISGTSIASGMQFVPIDNKSLLVLGYISSKTTRREYLERDIRQLERELVSVKGKLAECRAELKLLDEKEVEA